MNSQYPENLFINNRPKLPICELKDEDILYHSFSKDEMDDNGDIEVNSIRFPDFSCNWAKFSKPEDLKYRENGQPLDGCYAFTIEVAKFCNFALVVHDPIYDLIFPNYAHVEVRTLQTTDPVDKPDFEPPKNQKKPSKSNRLTYRKNLVSQKVIVSMPY